MRSRTWLVGGWWAALPWCAALAQGLTPEAALCPQPLPADAAAPPTLRVTTLWRMVPDGDPWARQRPALSHPSQARMSPGYEQLLAANSKWRLEVANHDGGSELIAGRYDAAQPPLESCAAEAVQLRDTEAEAACANNLGVLAAARGRYPEAQRQFERALRRYREHAAQVAAAPVPPPAPLPGALADFGLAMAQQMAGLARLPAQVGVVRASQNLGHVALALGQVQAAQRHFEQALADDQVLPPACRGTPAADLARVMQRLGRADRAAELAAQAPRPRADAAPDGMALEMGRVALGGGGGVTEPARPSPVAGITLVDEPMAFSSEAALQALLAAGAREAQAGQGARAAAAYARAALRAQAARRPDAEYAARAALMRLYAAAGRPGAAIAEGKRAVALAQAVQQGGGERLARDARRAYLRERQQVHAQLVRLLIDRDRLVEAEAVLRLLKQDEGRQFRDTAAPEPARLPEVAAEAAARGRAERAAAELQRLDSERRAVAADRTFVLLLQVDRARIEQLRLQAAADVVAYLADPKASRLPGAVARVPAEVRPRVQALMGGSGAPLVAALARIAEDAPRFTAAPPSAAQAAAVAEAARRATEFHAAFAPAFAQAMATPALSTIERQAADDARARADNEAAARAQVRAVGERARKAAGSTAGVERMAGSLATIYSRALAGQPVDAELQAFEAGLAGLPPEMLRSFASLAERQGAQFEKLAQRLPGADRQAAVQDATRRIDAAVARARQSPAAVAAATPPAVPAQPSVGDQMAEYALLMVDALERLWRLDHARERIETAELDADRGALEAAAPPVADDGTLALLARDAPEAALLHVLPGPDRTDLLLVGPRGRRALRVALPQPRLDELVARFGAALRDPGRDARPDARALHDALLAPVQPLLQAGGVQVLMLSLHGRLRFVPFAALHDGERWLVERYALALHPGSRVDELLRPTSPRWRVAAFGASAGGPGFTPLPGVPGELRSVVGDGAGARGQAWLDRAFDARALRGALAGGHQVLHVASHFRFEPGDAAASHLLLGDGSRLSLRELGGPDYRFDGFELVALSACQTGLSDDDAWGQEVDGLGALLMAQGARAVLASLWQVVDDSTAQLMGGVYRQRERDTRPLPVAVALQRAQLTLIRGEAAPDAGPTRGATLVSGASAAAPAARSHPYHWAPFVLMGNWR